MDIKLHIVHDITLVAEEIENLNHLYSLNILLKLCVKSKNIF